MEHDPATEKAEIPDWATTIPRLLATVARLVESRPERLSGSCKTARRGKLGRARTKAGRDSTELIGIRSQNVSRP
eukprot:3463292-Rhodomonas_salina.4